MADKVDPRTGELTTANYGWVKPTVGASTDAWGGYINADLDGIDSTVHGIQTSVPTASSTTPAMDGTAAVGTGTTWARADHVHPTDTSRAPLASPALTGVPIAPTAAPGTNTTQVATTAFVSALPVAMNDNRIINGNFAVNQRTQVSGTALTAAAYGHDRWKAGASGCTYTFTAVLPDTTITITAGSLLQVIEGGNIEGGVYILSWTGTAQARVYQGAPTGTYVASPLITASLTVGAGITVDFNAGTLTKVKLEIGSVATPYPRQSLAKSQVDCERYFRWLPFNFNFVATIASQTLTVPVNFPAMRATPTTSAVAADPNTTQSIANATTNQIIAQAAYGGYAALASSTSGSTYMIGYRVSASAEL